MDLPGEPFRLRRVFATSFSVWVGDLPRLVTLVFVVMSPFVGYQIYRYFVPREPVRLLDRESVTTYLLELTGEELVRGVFVNVAQAVVIYAVYRRLHGAPDGRSAFAALRRWWPIVRVTVALAALWLLVVFAGTWFAWAFRWSMALGPTVFGVGFSGLLLAVTTPFWVAVPAAVVERSGSFLLRSWALTRGRRLQVFGILAVLMGLEYVSGRLVGAVASDLPRAAAFCLWRVESLLFVSFAAVVGYRALRLEKDGLDVADLRKVFA